MSSAKRDQPIRHSRPALRKSLGQHHLRSGELCAPILRYLDAEDSLVVEIGPGGGVLTVELLRCGARVIALELDRSWAFHLARRLHSERLTLAIADALAVSWVGLAPSARVAGNLPYSISTALIERLLDQAPEGLRAAFLVQREVVARLLASPGSKDYGALTVIFAARARAESLGRVKPGSFVPPPKVESAFIGFEVLPRLGPAADRWPTFKATVRAGFKRRRKTLLNSLAASWGREESRRILAAADCDPGRRAESLSLDEWQRLHRARIQSV